MLCGLNMAYFNNLSVLLLLILSSTLAYDQENEEDRPLLLTPYIKSSQEVKARNLSYVEPTLFADLESYSGYITVNETYNSNLFFWYFPLRANGTDPKNPLLVWLHGGPGASSMYGLFTEAGPLTIENDEAVKMMITWASNYSIVFIDNPVGTGFSYTDDERGFATNEDTVGSELLNFMQQFLSMFPWEKTSPMFLVGSSYAGKFVPALAHYIQKFNDDSKSCEKINLKGLALGNPWIDPPNMDHRGEWAMELGLVDQETARVIRNHELAAKKFYKRRRFDLYANESLLAYQAFSNASGTNELNFLKEPSDGLGVSEEFVAFLNRADVQAALHTGRVLYSPYNATVQEKLDRDNWDTVRPWLEDVLEEYPVMCYSGQLDVIIPYGMSVRSYRLMQWSGAKDYRSAQRTKLFLDNGKLIGYEKSGGNFVDVLLRNAGHIAAVDQPEATKYLIDMFVSRYQ